MRAEAAINTQNILTEFLWSIIGQFIDEFGERLRVCALEITAEVEEVKVSRQLPPGLLQVLVEGLRQDSIIFKNQHPFVSLTQHIVPDEAMGDCAASHAVRTEGFAEVAEILAPFHFGTLDGRKAGVFNSEAL